MGGLDYDIIISCILLSYFTFDMIWNKISNRTVKNVEERGSPCLILFVALNFPNGEPSKRCEYDKVDIHSSITWQKCGENPCRLKILEITLHSTVSYTLVMSIFNVLHVVLNCLPFKKYISSWFKIVLPVIFLFGTKAAYEGMTLPKLVWF